MLRVTKSCLIVEPSPPMRAAFRALLSQYPFDLREVENGQDAMFECRREMPDFILLNSAMPDMNGHEFMSALHNTRNGRNAVVLYCPANSDANDVVMAMEKGAKEYLMKPFDADLLDFKLRQIGALDSEYVQNQAA